MAKPLRISLIGDEIARRMVEHVHPALVAEIERAIEEVLSTAEAEWPIGKRYRYNAAKPHSRDMFTQSFELIRSGNQFAIVAHIRNSAEYLRYIRPLKLASESGREKVAFVKWLWNPLRDRRDRIRAELPEIVPGGLRRG